MKKIAKAIGYLIGGVLILGVGADQYREKKLYLDITRDCSVYKNKDQKQFVDCWRSKRYAHYTLKKRLGHYENEIKPMVGAVE